MTDLRALVLEAWANALGAPAAGDDEDFFDAGGDSLAFLQMTVTVEERTGLRLPVADVLAAPTPAGIVALLARQDEATAGSAP
jgi:acyl carrier protein